MTMIGCNDINSVDNVDGKVDDGDGDIDMLFY